MDDSGGGSAALIHLSCFGGFRVTAERPLGALFLQPSGVAMLAVLAAVADAGVSVEELRELAWGELPEAEGRAAVAQALTALWRGGNGDSLLATGNLVAFHGDRVTTDVSRFRDACAGGDTATALAIYEGPFFDGVVLDVGERFAEWLEATRAQFNTEYQELSRAARRAARAATSAPDWNAPIALALPEPEAVADEPTAAMESVSPTEAESAPAPVIAEPLGVAAADETELPRRSNRRWFAVAAAVLFLAAVGGLLFRRDSPAAFGQKALDRGDDDAAVAAYVLAVTAHPRDAWLWYQLARSADAQGNGALADSAATRADSLRSTLDATRAALVHGFERWRAGSTNEALTTLDSLAEAAPDSPEVAAAQGEIAYRSGALVGRAPMSARPALERSVKLRPAAAGWQRLLQLALAAHDTALAQRSYAGLRAVMGSAADSTFGWMRSAWSDDTLPLQREVARAATLPAAVLLRRASSIGFDAGRTLEALDFTAPLLGPTAPRDSRVQARTLRAALFGAVGDWTRADSERVAMEHDWRWGALELEVAMALAPSRTTRPAELRTLRERVMRFVVDSSESTGGDSLLPPSSRTLRLYLAGELSARLNDARGVQSAIDSLASPKLGELTLPRRGGSYALSLQALQLLARGDSAAALARLEQLVFTAPAGAHSQLWVNGSLERRRRAALLESAGRPGEAAPWIAASAAYPVDLLFGPAIR
ncbi:MAG: hypothetical protein V4558_01710 [Gemmatimonadota bacterium]